MQTYSYSCFQSFPLNVHTFTRFGGVSQGVFSSLNLGNKTQDVLSCVQKNRALVEEFLGAPVIFADLEHSDQIAYVSEVKKEGFKADALITDKKGIGLGITHADCQAVVLYDPLAEVGGIAHIGWRGNVKNLLGKLVKTLVVQMGCSEKRLICSLSPSLGPSHAEFRNFSAEFPQKLWKYVDKRFCIDLWQMSIDQLMEAGVLRENIEAAYIDTYTSCDFFSYRRERETGRNGTILVL
jgi:YfiH family protein